MTGRENGELPSLMTEALDTCLRLQSYSDENFYVFMDDDDEKIMEVINHREGIIDVLVSLESRIDALVDSGGGADEPAVLPEDAEEIRRAVRSVLNDISQKDLEIMKIVSGRMQWYRTETLKARSQRSLSAYVSSSIYYQEAGDRVDLTK